jgi:hypothetical protein
LCFETCQRPRASLAPLCVPMSHRAIEQSPGHITARACMQPARSPCVGRLQSPVHISRPFPFKLFVWSLAGSILPPQAPAMFCSFCWLFWQVGSASSGVGLLWLLCRSVVLGVFKATHVSASSITDIPTGLAVFTKVYLFSFPLN